MIYTVKTSKSFEKDFSRLDSITQSRVLTILEKLTRSPFENCKKLKQTDVGIFRQRIGDYRLRYDVVKKEIYLYRIRHRKEVYRF